MNGFHTREDIFQIISSLRSLCEKFDLKENHGKVTKKDMFLNVFEYVIRKISPSYSDWICTARNIARQCRLSLAKVNTNVSGPRPEPSQREHNSIISHTLPSKHDRDCAR